MIQANPYLKDPTNRQRLLSLTVSSSKAIEGIHRVWLEATRYRPTAVRSVIIREPVVSYGSRR